MVREHSVDHLPVGGLHLHVRSRHDSGQNQKTSRRSTRDFFVGFMELYVGKRLAIVGGASLMASSGWQTLQALKARNPRCNPICIGESIWISTDYNDGERGLVEFHCPSGRITHTAKYPNGFEPMDHSMAGSADHGIVLVDGAKGKLITFNTVSKTYGATVTIPKLGDATSSLMIQGNVHIIHGQGNWKNQYIIYSTKQRKVMEFKDKVLCPRMGWIAFTKREDDSKFYKFGGKNGMGGDLVASVFVGTLQNGDASKPIIWKSHNFDMKQPLSEFGYIQCGPFVATFGGIRRYENDNPRSVLKIQCGPLDVIYILDTRANTGWIESSVKCPMKSKYVAVLDKQHRVHLFSQLYGGGKRRVSSGHYCIAMKDLVPGFQQHLDDEKGGDHAVSSANLKDEVEKLKKTNSSLMELQKGLESDNMRLKAENGRTKVMNESLREELKRFKKTNADLSQKQKGLESDVMRLNAESKKLSDEVAVYQDEQKEAQRKIAELEDKVKELEPKAVDPSKFIEWDYYQIHCWIMGLENERFKKYAAVLMESLSVDEVIGEDLLDVTPLTLKAWGVKDRKECKGLNKHVQELVSQNQ